MVQTYSAEETAQYEATFEANKAVMYSEGAPNKKYKQKPWLVLLHPSQNSIFTVRPIQKKIVLLLVDL